MGGEGWLPFLTFLALHFSEDFLFFSFFSHKCDGATSGLLLNFYILGSGGVRRTHHVKLTGTAAGLSN
jgi:hypothetical protein